MRFWEDKNQPEEELDELCEPISDVLYIGYTGNSVEICTKFNERIRITPVSGSSLRVQLMEDKPK